ncbi:methyl-accepting chemotaxis protein [Vibrio sp. SM6]|uniref:Methyl-accepting chemotaxis protein n=1 Tax=Vibrio agarilyticus TaxID=2726741 RepID=A0A7X8YGQ9_9VIBR|nr:methyl-accepting chemotaxis protein [Vibrio agarilyticus]NLS12686.1 methyl-accepting chemotaxis protein [Vibrio agarilyticus]
MLLQHFSLKAKLGLGTGLPLLLMVILAFVSVENTQVQRDANAGVDQTHRIIETALELEIAAINMETGMRGYLLVGRDEFLEPYHLGLASFTQLMEKLEQGVRDDPIQLTRLKEINQTIRDWVREITEPNIAMRSEIGRTVSMNGISAEVGKARGKVYFDTFREQITEFIQFETLIMTQKQQASQQAAVQSNQIVISATVLAIIVGVVIATLVLRSIAGPVSDVARALNALARGDLTCHVETQSTDEIGAMAQNYNQAVIRTRQVLNEVLETTQQVVARGNTITEANEAMATELTQQSNQIAEMVTAFDQSAASIQEVALSSAQATTSGQAAGDSASVGGEVVQNTIIGMHQIEQAVSASAQSVTELGRRGAEIGDIVIMINGIAEQTNLLALNAAIEAARAGEAGRGFAVVADEVRALAERTTAATQEISTSIEAIQTETRLAVERMDAGTTHVQQGMTLAEQAGARLSDIVTNSLSVAQMIDSIAAAAEQQSQVSHSVTKNVEMIATVSSNANQQAMSTVDAAKTLAQQAEQLQALVAQFRVA